MRARLAAAVFTLAITTCGLAGLRHLVGPTVAEAPPRVAAKLARIERGDIKRYDSPGEIAAFQLRRRLPAGATRLPAERYVAARDEMAETPQYSTALDQKLPSR